MGRMRETDEDTNEEISQDIPNQSEGEFNPTQAHFWYLKIAILAIVAQKTENFLFLFSPSER